MKLSDKIVRLRKSNGMSQEELADKLGVSRQAISRWEMGTAMPDATNILQLSRLFQVTTDYLLNDEYQSDNDLPKVKEVKTDGIHQIMIFLITLEVMVLIIQFMSVVILQNIFFGVLSFIPFIAMVGGFEYAYQKKANEQNERTIQFRKRFYKVSAWLGAYFPIRLLAMALVHFYPRPINSLALECVILRHRQQRRYPRPQISAGAQRAEHFSLPSGAGLQAKGHDRYSVDAGLCAPRRRLVSAQ